MYYLDECANFWCPVCKPDFTTKAYIKPNNPNCNASTMKTILCTIDGGKLFGVKCNHYIIDFDKLYFYAPKESLEFYNSRKLLLKQETNKQILLWLSLANMY